MSLIADKNSPKILKPSKQPFHLPSPFVSTQGPSILRRRLLAIRPVRGHHLNPLSSQPLIQLVTVVGFIPNQPLGLDLHPTGLQSRLHQFHLMRRSTCCGYGDRKTRAVCHGHDLRTLAPLGLTHPGPPFLARTKVPSIKHSLRSSPPRLLRSSASALSTASRTPRRTHSWKRRWQVWYGGYRSGISCQGAPVRRIQRIPLRTSRSSLRGRPRPLARRAGTGMSCLTISHCSSVRSIGFTSSRLVNQFYHT